MKSVKKNLVYNILYQILVILLPLVTAPYISRTLGPRGTGIYSYTYSVVYYFQLFAMLGISNHGNRCIAAVRDDKEETSKVFYQIYTIQKVTFTIAIVLYLLYIFFFNNENTVIAIIQVLFLVSGLLDISWFFFGIEEFKLTVTRNALIKILTTLCVFVFVKTEGDVWKYTLIIAAGTFLSQFYLWLYLGKYVKKVKIYIKDIRKHILPVLSLFIPVVAYSIYKVMDKIMLGNMSTYEQVGFYQNAEKIINIPMGIITALGTVMLPRMSNLISHGENEQARNYISISFKIVTLIGAPIAFGLIAVADIFTPVFFGSGYDPCINLIRLLSITVFSMAWANVIRTQYLIPLHRDKVYILSTFCGAVVNFIVNLLMIPRLNSLGAAIGTVLAEFCVLVVQVIMIHREIPVVRYCIKQIPYLILGTIMYIIVSVLSGILADTLLSLIFLIAVGGVVYCVLLIIYSYIARDEVFSFIDGCIRRFVKNRKRR